MLALKDAVTLNELEKLSAEFKKTHLTDHESKDRQSTERRKVLPNVGKEDLLVEQLINIQKEGEKISSRKAVQSSKKC